LIVSLVVVAASVAAVLRLALAEPAQPATESRASRRARMGRRDARGARAQRRALARRQLAARAAPANLGAGPIVVSTADIDIDRVGALRRIRSGLALLLLLALVGALLAAAVGTVLFMAGLALRSAVS
jgi:hypothetical protein